MASELDADPALELINDVVINQVLVGIETDDPERVTADAVERIQRDGTCWLAGTTWRGRPAIRVSISNWLTTEDDVRRSAAAIRSAVQGVPGRCGGRRGVLGEEAGSATSPRSRPSRRAARE